MVELRYLNYDTISYMIIDSHVHYGYGSAWGDFSPEFLLSLLGDNIDYAICSNLEGIDASNFKNELDCNLDMLKISKKYKKIKPLAVCQVDKSLNNHIMKYLLTEYPEFIGLKFHPECMKLPANSQKYDKYLELAKQFNKPCLFHSGNINSKFSSPALIYEKAKQFPDVPIILGHLSTGPRESHIEAINIMLESIENEDATLYADVSWMDFGTGNHEDTIMLIEKLKTTSKGDYTNRVMWASDAPVGEFNQKQELYARNLSLFSVKITNYFNDEILLQNLLFNNANNLYKIR